MELSNLLSAEVILSDLKVNSKKQLLQELAEKASVQCSMPKQMIFEALLQRERLGSTGLGEGIAIPHGKLQGLDRVFGVFARLQKPVAYEAIDDQPVDLVFLLLAPEGSGADHLKVLSKVARLMRNSDKVSKIRAIKDPYVLHSILVDEEQSFAA